MFVCCPGVVVISTYNIDVDPHGRTSSKIKCLSVTNVIPYNPDLVDLEDREGSLSPIRRLC